MARSWRSSLRDSLVATLGQPAWWALALSAFLVRGGILVVLAPIVSLPSAAGAADLLGPAVSDVALGASPAVLALLIVAGAAVLAGLIIGSAAVGTWLELALVELAAADDELALPQLPQRPSGAQLGRAVAARLVPHAGTFLALTYGALRLIDATYAELLAPGNPTIPVAVRVLGRAPEAVVLVGLAWILGEAIGGRALREVARGLELAAGLRAGLRGIGSLRGLGLLVVTDLVIVGLSGVGWLFIGRSWDDLRVLLVDGGSVADLATTLLLFSLAWAAGLSVLAIGLAWRSVGWTAESLRRPG